MLAYGNIYGATRAKGPEPASPAPAGDIADLNNPADRVQVEGNRYNDEHMALVE